MNPPTLPGASLDESRRFEDAWHRLGPQPIELFLPPADDPAYLPTLAELVLIEMEFTWKARGRSGDPPPVDDYVRRFPALADPTYLQVLRSYEGELRRRIDAQTVIGTASSPGGGSTSGAPRLPGYEVLGFLGRGGMGVVYKARHVALNRVVAVKMLRDADGNTAEVRERFRVEAEAVAALRHPNIVQVYEVGEHDGRPYFTLEYVAGGSLDRLLGGVPQPPQPAARLVALVARAVDHAHAHGIIHRDLKPANVLLERTEDKRQSTDNSAHDTAADGEMTRPPDPSSVVCPLSAVTPKVTDFGLARRMDLSGHTRTGDVLGTPCYMAPEQARGTSDVGPAADVYSLGAILYECLTGRPPFQGVTALATLGLVTSAKPVPPSKLQPGLPRDVETVCLKCLAKEPARRYATAAALADDLERFLSDRPVLARPTGRVERLVRWARRNPVVAGLAAALLVVVVGGVIGLTGLWLRAEANAADARREAGRADANFRKARDTVDQLLTRVGYNKLANTPHMEQVRREVLEDALRYYQGFLAEREADPAVRFETGRAYLRLGEIRLELGQHAAAEEAIREARNLLEQAGGGPDRADNRHDLGTAYTLLGQALAARGRTADAEAAFRQALALREARLANVPADLRAIEDVAHVWANLGNVLKSEGRLKEAEEARESAAGRFRRLVAAAPQTGEYKYHLANALDARAALLDELGRADDAEAAHREAVSLFARLIAVNPHVPRFRHDAAAATANLGRHLHDRGRDAEAERLFRDAIPPLEQLAVEFPATPRYREAVAATTSLLVRLLKSAGRYAEAEPLLRRLHDVWRKLAADFPAVPEYRSRQASARGQLLELLAHAGRPFTPAFVEEHREVVAQFRALADEFPAVPGHRAALGSALERLAEVLTRAGRLPDAEPAYREAVEVTEKLSVEFPTVPDHGHRLVHCLTGLGHVLYRTGRVDGAVDLNSRAIRVAAAVAAAHPHEPEYRNSFGLVCHNQAVLLKKLGQTAEAAGLFRQARDVYEKLAADSPAVTKYRETLASTYLFSGPLVDPPEAERGYRRAIELADQLVAQQPGRPDFLSLRAEAPVYYARFHLGRGDAARARDLLQQAVPVQQAALKANPRNPNYLRLLGRQYAALAETRLALGDHAAASEAARHLSRIDPDDGPKLREAAGLLARCATVVAKDRRSSQGERDATAAGYVGEALDLLRRAVQKGVADADDLRKDPYLEPLRKHEAFDRIVADAQKVKK